MTSYIPLLIIAGLAKNWRDNPEFFGEQTFMLVPLFLIAFIALWFSKFTEPEEMDHDDFEIKFSNAYKLYR